MINDQSSSWYGPSFWEDPVYSGETIARALQREVPLGWEGVVRRLYTASFRVPDATLVGILERQCEFAEYLLQGSSPVALDVAGELFQPIQGPIQAFLAMDVAGELFLTRSLLASRGLQLPWSSSASYWVLGMDHDGNHPCVAEFGGFSVDMAAARKLGATGSGFSTHTHTRSLASYSANQNC